jgi:hypothetical protein
MKQKEKQQEKTEEERERQERKPEERGIRGSNDFVTFLDYTPENAPIFFD